MTHGASAQSNMTPNSEDIDIIKLSRRDETRPLQKLTALEMSWLHHHIIHDMFPSMESEDAGQWRDDYIKLVRKYEKELKTDISNQYKFEKQIDSFTAWMSQVLCHLRRPLPDHMETFDRDSYRQMYFQKCQ